MTARSSTLGRLPLFERLTATQLEELAASLRVRRYGKGEYICHREDPGDCLFIIDDGTVRIGLTSDDGREVTLTLLTNGDFFGELALLDGQPRSADAVAVETTRLLRLSRDVFLRFLEENPSTAPVLLAGMSRQVRRLTDQVYDAAFLDLPTRLAKALLSLAGTEAEAGDEVSLRATQLEVANMIGATRESVNKWLHFYQKRGLVRLGRGTITISRERDLKAYASPYPYI